ncbi:MAG: hypothetical protein Q9173_002051 [Seirophora scorigena]
MVDPDWFTAQASATSQGNPTANPVAATDPFQKRKSQAFVEATKGDACICTPEDNAPDSEFNQDLAWGGWKYPALTRNRDVTKVIRVDRSTGVREYITYLRPIIHQTTKIWQHKEQSVNRVTSQDITRCGK